MCPFCEIDERRVIRRMSLAFSARDGFPVSEGHTLIISVRHVASVFDLTNGELSDCLALLRSEMESLSASDPTIEGWNVGVNDGRAAGQTVAHVHLHLIPRRSDDTENPAGGVRNVIPGMGDWRTP